MRLIEELSRSPDPWYGNNIVAIFQDGDEQYWKVHYNDQSGLNSPFTKKVKVYHLTKTVEVNQWVEY